MAWKNLLVNGKNNITALKRSNALADIQTAMANRTTATNVNSVKTPNLPTPTVNSTTFWLRKSNTTTPVVQNNAINNLNTNIVQPVQSTRNVASVWAWNIVETPTQSRFIGFQTPKGKSVADIAKNALYIPTAWGTAWKENKKEEKKFRTNEQALLDFQADVLKNKGKMKDADIKRLYPEFADRLDVMKELQTELRPIVKNWQGVDGEQLAQYYPELIQSKNLKDVEAIRKQSEKDSQKLQSNIQKVEKVVTENFDVLSPDGQKYVQDYLTLAWVIDSLKKNYRIVWGANDDEILQYAINNNPQLKWVADELQRLTLSEMDKATIDWNSQSIITSLISGLQKMTRQANTAVQNFAAEQNYIAEQDWTNQPNFFNTTWNTAANILWAADEATTAWARVLWNQNVNYNVWDKEAQETVEKQQISDLLAMWWWYWKTVWWIATAPFEYWKLNPVTKPVVEWIVEPVFEWISKLEKTITNPLWNALWFDEKDKENADALLLWEIFREFKTVKKDIKVRTDAAKDIVSDAFKRTVKSNKRSEMKKSFEEAWVYDDAWYIKPESRTQAAKIIAKEFAKDFSENFKNDAKQWWDVVDFYRKKEGVKSYKEQINDIKQWAKDVVDTVKETGKKAWKTIAEWIDKGFDKMDESIETRIDKIRNKVTKKQPTEVKAEETIKDTAWWSQPKKWVIGKVTEWASKIWTKIYDNTVEPVATKVAEWITSTTAPQDKLFKALNPSVNVLSRKKGNYETIKQNSDRANELIIEYGRTPKNSAEYYDAIVNTKKDIWNNGIKQWLDTYKYTTIDAADLINPVKEAMREFTQEPLESLKWDVKLLMKELEAIENKRIISLEAMENKKQQINAILEYWLPPDASQIYEKWMRELNRQIWIQEDRMISELPWEFKKFKRDYGALTAIQDDAQKLMIKDAKKKLGGNLIQNWSRIEGLGKMGKAMVWKGSFLEWAAQIILWESLWKVKDTNFLIESGFNALRWQYWPAKWKPEGVKIKKKPPTPRLEDKRTDVEKGKIAELDRRSEKNKEEWYKTKNAVTSEKSAVTEKKAEPKAEVKETPKAEKELETRVETKKPEPKAIKDIQNIDDLWLNKNEFKNRPWLSDQTERYWKVWNNNVIIRDTDANEYTLIVWKGGELKDLPQGYHGLKGQQDSYHFTGLTFDELKNNLEKAMNWDHFDGMSTYKWKTIIDREWKKQIMVEFGKWEDVPNREWKTKNVVTEKAGVTTQKQEPKKEVKWKEKFDLAEKWREHEDIISDDKAIEIQDEIRNNDNTDPVKRTWYYITVNWNEVVDLNMKRHEYSFGTVANIWLRALLPDVSKWSTVWIVNIDTGKTVWKWTWDWKELTTIKSEAKPQEQPKNKVTAKNTVGTEEWREKSVDEDKLNDIREYAKEHGKLNEIIPVWKERTLQLENHGVMLTDAELEVLKNEWLVKESDIPEPNIPRNNVTAQKTAVTAPEKKSEWIREFERWTIESANDIVEKIQNKSYGEYVKKDSDWNTVLWVKKWFGYTTISVADWDWQSAITAHITKDDKGEKVRFDLWENTTKKSEDTFSFIMTRLKLPYIVWFKEENGEKIPTVLYKKTWHTDTMQYGRSFNGVAVSKEYRLKDTDLTLSRNEAEQAEYNRIVEENRQENQRIKERLEREEQEKKDKLAQQEQKRKGVQEFLDEQYENNLPKAKAKSELTKLNKDADRNSEIAYYEWFPENYNDMEIWELLDILWNLDNGEIREVREHGDVYSYWYELNRRQNEKGRWTNDYRTHLNKYEKDYLDFVMWKKRVEADLAEEARDMEENPEKYASEEQLKSLFKEWGTTVKTQWENTENLVTDKAKITTKSEPVDTWKIKRQTGDSRAANFTNTIMDIIESNGGLKDWYLKVTKEPYEPLYIEEIGGGKVAIGQTYIQNWDVMFDPEIVFGVDENGRLQAETIRNDSMWIYEDPIKPNDPFIETWEENLRPFIKEEKSDFYKKYIENRDETSRNGLLGRMKSDLDYIINQNLGTWWFRHLRAVNDPERQIQYMRELKDSLPDYDIDIDWYEKAIKEIQSVAKSENRNIIGKNNSLTTNNPTNEQQKLWWDNQWLSQGVLWGSRSLSMNEGTNWEQLKDTWGVIQDLHKEQLDNDAISKGYAAWPAIWQQQPRQLTKNEARAVNQNAKDILAKHEFSTNPKDYTKEEIDILRQYEWAWGLTKYGEDTTGALDQFYTPQAAIDAVWHLVDKYKDNKDTYDVLEPTVWTGRFLRDAKNERYEWHEIDKTPWTIAQILHPNADIHVWDFENQFMDFTWRRVQDYGRRSDIVVWNPPYSQRKTPQQKAWLEPNIKRSEEFFIKKWVDILNQWGMLAMVVPSTFLTNPMDYAKEEILKQASLIDAYRLPEWIFPYTQVWTDIIVLKKNKDGSDLISDNKWFEEHPEKVLGEVKERVNRFGKLEKYVDWWSNPQSRLNAIYEDAKAVEPTPVQQAESYSPTEAIETTPVKQKTTTEVTGTAKNKVTATAKTPVKRTVKPWTKIEKQTIIVWEKTDLVDTIFGDWDLDNKLLEYAKKTDINWYVQWPALELVEKDPKNLNFYKYHAVTNDLYFAGDIFEKLDTLEREKADLSEAQYKKQKDWLLAVLPEQYTIENHPFVSPLDENVMTLENEDRETVKQMFLQWFRENVSYDTMNKRMAQEYVNWQPMKSGSASTYWLSDKEKERVLRHEKSVVMEQTNEKFNEWLWTRLDKKMQQKIVDKFNKENRSYVLPRYDKMPLPLKWISDTFMWDKFTPKEAQIEATNFLLSKWAWIAALWVGRWKTIVGTMATREAQLRWRNKRPLIVAPSPTLYAQWVRTIREQYPDWEIVNLWKLNVDDIKRLKRDLWDDPKDWIKDWQVAIVSREWLANNIEFKPKTKAELQAKLKDVMEDKSETAKKTARAEESLKKKIEEWLAPWEWKADKHIYHEWAEFLRTMYNNMLDMEKEEFKEYFKDAVKEENKDLPDNVIEADAEALWSNRPIFIEDLWIDHLTVDEMHNFKNVFTSANMQQKDWKQQVNRYGGIIKWKSSNRWQKLYLASQYVMDRNGNRNVFWLTATPFNNQPIEIYNMLSMVGKNELEKIWLKNINDFFSKFAEFKEWLAPNAAWTELEYKFVMKDFANKRDLQRLITKFILFKWDAKDLVRPEYRLRTPVLEMSPLQKQMQTELEIKALDNTEKWDVLSATNWMIGNLITPFMVKWCRAPTWWQDFIDNSAKLKFIAQAIKNLRETWNQDWVFIYMPKWVEFHETFREALSHITGTPKEKIWIINTKTDAKKDDIAEAFRNGKINILIWGKNTAEWIDLQDNGYVTFITDVWRNTTERTQVDGRVWRQWNLNSHVLSVVPLMKDSADIIYMWKADQKWSRINNALDMVLYGGEWDLSPEEAMTNLMTDPWKKAKSMINIEKQWIDKDIYGVRTQKDRLVRMKDNLEKAQWDIAALERKIETEKQVGRTWNIQSLKNQIKDIEKAQAYLEKYLEANGSVPTVEELNKNIENLDAEIKALEEKKEEFSNADKNGILDKMIKDIQEEYKRNSASIKDYDAYLEDLKADYNEVKKLGSKKELKEFLENRKNVLANDKNKITSWKTQAARASRPSIRMNVEEREKKNATANPMNKVTSKANTNQNDISDLDPDLASKVWLKYKIKDANDEVLHGLIDYVLKKKWVKPVKNGLRGKIYSMNQALPKLKKWDDLSKKNAVDRLWYKVKDMALYRMAKKNNEYILDEKKKNDNNTHINFKVGKRSILLHMSNELYNILKWEWYIVSPWKYFYLKRKKKLKRGP